MYCREGAKRESRPVGENSDNRGNKCFAWKYVSICKGQRRTQTPTHKIKFITKTSKITVNHNMKQPQRHTRTWVSHTEMHSVVLLVCSSERQKCEEERGRMRDNKKQTKIEKPHFVTLWMKAWRALISLTHIHSLRNWRLITTLKGCSLWQRPAVYLKEEASRGRGGMIWISWKVKFSCL